MPQVQKNFLLFGQYEVAMKVGNLKKLLDILHC